MQNRHNECSNLTQRFTMHAFLHRPEYNREPSRNLRLYEASALPISNAPYTPPRHTWVGTSTTTPPTKHSVGEKTTDAIGVHPYLHNLIASYIPCFGARLQVPSSQPSSTVYASLISSKTLPQLEQDIRNSQSTILTPSSYKQSTYAHSTTHKNITFKRHEPSPDNLPRADSPIHHPLAHKPNRATVSTIEQHTQPLTYKTAIKDTSSTAPHKR
jgi:hypothetical protein